MSFQIYRNTSVGETLVETLDELAREGKLPEELAITVLNRFDTSMSQAIDKFVTGKATMKASMKTYHYYENVWTFSLRNVDFKLNQAGSGSMSTAQNMVCESTKVVVVDASLGKATQPAA